MTDGLKKLRALLHELFQLDDADLDFGIYRILRLRRQEVERFLEHDLAERVERAFTHYKSVDRTAEEADLRTSIADLRKYRLSDTEIEANPTVIEHRKRIALAVSRETLQDDVFARLYDFFSRYYDRGDFLSRRSYRGTSYAVPYAGEEVKLHWANADQYYIKSADRHAHYAFDLSGGLGVRFEVVGGGEERDNAKAVPGLERAYQLDTTPYEVHGRKHLVLRFVFRADPAPDHDQAWHVERVADLLKSDAALITWGNALLKVSEEGARTPLERHFERFRRSESFDYFIHKDLDGFLRRELDHYLKTEVMRLDDIESLNAPRVEEYLSKLKVVRSLAGDVITFLSQVEEFQKRLWLKQKFVLETRWCVSMQLVPRDLWPEVIANDAQREAWVRLFAIDKITRDLAREGYSSPVTEKFLEQNPTLVLDTVHFPRDFTDRLLATFDDLDGKTLGTLFHAENFQALQLIQERYRGKAKCVYIDPPYNTGGDGFAYKDNYQHSSWLAMMFDRLQLGATLLSPSGSFWMSMDDNEVTNARSVLDLTLGQDSFVACNVWQKRYSRDSRPAIGNVHEYLFTYAAVPKIFEKSRNLLKPDEESLAVYRNPNNDPKGRWRPIPMTAQGTRKNQMYEVTSPAGVVHKPPRGRCWSTLESEYLKLRAAGRIWFGNDGKGQPNIIRYLTEVEGLVPWTWWPHDDAGHTDEALKEVYELIDTELEGITPKPTRLLRRVVDIATSTKEADVVIDYFAGTGTTGGAVLAANQETGSSRRFVLVEASEWFDKALMPRLLKLMHSSDWTDCVPVSRKGPIGLMQVMRLESYDDTLDNLVLSRPAAVEPLFEREPDFARDYVLRYMLEHETRESPSLLGLAAFERPFSRTLKVTRNDAIVESSVDLIETFHWLLGMTVRTRKIDEAVRVSRGSLPDGAGVVVVWRDPEIVGAAALEQWFEQRLLPTLEGVSVVYVNGDQQVERLRPDNAGWRLERTEGVFLARMFPKSRA